MHHELNSGICTDHLYQSSQCQHFTDMQSMAQRGGISHSDMHLVYGKAWVQTLELPSFTDVGVGRAGKRLACMGSVLAPVSTGREPWRVS